MWDEFRKRAIYEDDCLRKDELPIKEPQRWCKLCKYRAKCDLNIKTENEINNFTEKQKQKVFETIYEKKAIWAGKETRGYKEWKKSLNTT